MIQAKGGSTLAFYYVSPSPDCSCEDYGINNNYHLMVKPEAGYGNVTVRSVVQTQLAQMYANGQRTISVRPSLGNGAVGNSNFDFLNGLSPQYLANLADFLADIKATGFEEAIVELSWINDPPHEWTTFKPALYNAWWNVIQQVRPIIVNAQLPYKLGLGMELMPVSGYSSQAWIQFTKNLWSQYVSTYGSSDTLGFSVVCDSSDCPNRLNAIPEVYGTSYPSVIDIHIYGSSAGNQLQAASQALNQSGLSNIPLQIGEIWFNDAPAAMSLAQATITTGRPIRKLIQWPLLYKNAPLTTANCDAVNVVPINFNAYSARGF